MWIDRLLESRTTHAVELAARFAEYRHHVAAENVSNIDTPDYHTRRLDLEPFQASLRAALDDARAAGADRLNLRGNAQFTTLPDGRTAVQPMEEPAPNVLFHDGTNARVERLMSDAAANALYYQLATTLLGRRFNLVEQAIRGRTT